ncbi:MAG TPA: cytochrome-c peroxidase, partial [Planctomycetaceae bacterium]|nr:cytochrome-c peroxidase [Planctomycetaceae bacterium]
PGEGPLTVEQIKAWLDDPANHEVLEIRLPLGLDKGQNQIKGVDQNPMTRAKIELGRQLYFDRRLSVDSTVSCADCHHPDEGWTRHTRFGIGVNGQQGNRNSPVSYNRILSDRQFWDGRAASLEEQAIGPIANPIEMAFTHDDCVKRLQSIEGYRLQFEKIFGELTIENVGRAIATFERAIVTGPSPFDYYEQFKPFEQYTEEDLAELKEDDPEQYAAYQAAKKGVDEHPMSDSAKRGLEIFFGQKGGCTACHVGPNLTDEKYWHIGIGLTAENPDLGRKLGEGEEPKKGFDGFKTPTIRSVALSAPYMHDGSLNTLMEVVEHYNKGGIVDPEKADVIKQHIPTDKIKPLNLTDQEKADLVAFMEACTGSFPPVERERLPQE